MEKLRTISQAYADLVAEDPDTPISLNFIKELCRFGEIPTMLKGNRYMFRMSDLTAYVNDQINNYGAFDRQNKKGEYIREKAKRNDNE